VTLSINYMASVRLARLAKQAGVTRFIYASSCSVYGAGREEWLTERSDPSPQTTYARCKLLVETDVGALAAERFSPVFLRNATAYGASPRMRFDIVLNNLAGLAWTTGRISMTSDGTPWRPLVHVEDICRAFLAVLHAPRELVHNEAFNVGRSEENYRIREIAEMVREVVPGSVVKYAEGGGPDLRCYRVNCDKIARTLPEFKPQWTVRKGVEQLYAAYRRHGLTAFEFMGTRYLRIKRIKQLQSEGRLDDSLRWRAAIPLAAAAS
jgi:nucleoside-diphosphate-sugar epimerase